MFSDNRVLSCQSGNPFGSDSSLLSAEGLVRCILCGSEANSESLGIVELGGSETLVVEVPSSMGFIDV